MEPECTDYEIKRTKLVEKDIPAVPKVEINELIVVDAQNKQLVIKKTDKLGLIGQSVTATLEITLPNGIKATFDLEVSYLFSNGPSSKECRSSFEESQGPPVVTCS